jgi:hypothetical protein
MNNLPGPERELISLKNAAIFGAALIIGSVLYLLTNQSMEINIKFFDFIVPLVGFLSFSCLIYAAKRSRIYGKRVYLAWLFIAFSILLYVIGDTIWAFMEVVSHVQPFPSTADIFYLLYYLFFIIGLFLMFRSLDNPENIYKTILDASIVVVSAIWIFWNTLSVFIIAQGTTSAFSLYLFYIIRDFVIFMLLINLVLKQVNKWDKNPIILLTAALLVQFITDLVITYQFSSGIYVSGQFTEIGWLSCYVLIGLAGILQGNIAGVDTDKLAIEMKPVKHVIFSFPVIWVALVIFMLIWGYNNVSPSNFMVIELKVLLFFLLLMIRRLISVNESWQFYWKVKNRKV